MKSLRIDKELSDRLARAAAIEGESMSEFIRTAAAQRADAVISERAQVDFSDVIAVLNSGADSIGHRTHEAFLDSLVDDAGRGKG